jgi:hypothetical protein
VTTELTITKITGESMTVSMTMRMRRCDAGHITRWSTFKHLASTCAMLPQRLPWLTILDETQKH